MSENKYQTAEMKEHDNPSIIVPLYNKECTELIFFFLVLHYQKLNLKIIIFQIMKNQQLILNQYILK